MALHACMSAICTGIMAHLLVWGIVHRRGHAAVSLSSRSTFAVSKSMRRQNQVMSGSRMAADHQLYQALHRE
jgi:hypothetical protein